MQAVFNCRLGHLYDEVANLILAGHKIVLIQAMYDSQIITTDERLEGYRQEVTGYLIVTTNNE